jgi:PhnB protein
MGDDLDLLRWLYPEADVGVAALATARERLMAFVRRESLPLPRVIPYLVYDDVEGAIAWLDRAFGFREHDRKLAPDGSVGHAMLELAGAPVMVGPPGVHGSSPRGGVSAMIHVEVDDVDAHFRRATAAGATVVIPLRDEPWGARRYQAADLEGHQWNFAQQKR